MKASYFTFNFCSIAETSSAYGGGAPGLSNRFVASFLWLDKLGLAAKMGMKVVVRQTLYNGYYSLIDDDLFPLPVSFLHTSSLYVIYFLSDFQNSYS